MYDHMLLLRVSLAFHFANNVSVW